MTIKIDKQLHINSFTAINVYRRQLAIGSEWV